MITSAIISVAFTGSRPTKADNSAVPITIEEQIDRTRADVEAGATIAHSHVRDGDDQPNSDSDRFERLMEGIQAVCPSMIVRLSSGGRSGAGQA